MKHGKIAIIIFLFLSTNVYPQYLVTDDIDIFDSYFPALVASNFGMSENASDAYNSFAYHYYMLLFMTMRSFFVTMDNSIDEIELDERIQVFNDCFKALLNYDIAEELESRYNSVGWTVNGNKKFVTILFGSIYIALLRDLDIVKSMLEEGYWEGDDRISMEKSVKTLHYVLGQVITAFDEADLNILKNDMEFVVRVAGTLKSLRIF